MTAAVYDLSHRDLRGPAAAGVAATVYLGAVAVTDPFSAMTVRGVAIECPIHAATGGFCPGCGSTRAVHELLHGDLVGSLVCHPLVLPLVGLLAYLWVSWIARRRGRDPWWARTPTELPAAVPMLLVVGFVALTVVRNVPGFEWLPPPDVAP
ncbi:MAG: DUF2752 domain-containing protein [Acidimicrobiales bacterium]|nr:DUF2752 domain-containing protein [Acidimicrobiales bacterium]